MPHASTFGARMKWLFEIFFGFISFPVKQSNLRGLRENVIVVNLLLVSVNNAIFQTEYFICMG